MDLQNNVNSPQRGMVQDLNPELINSNMWTLARNAHMNSHMGQMQFLQNEPSNTFCVNIPYTPIGFIRMPNFQWIVFSTDNFNSEIGMFNEQECTYTTIVNCPCLQFNTSNLVIGTFRETFNCTYTIYWTDGVNPRRYLNLADISYTYTTQDDQCQTQVFTTTLDCTQILMSPNIQVPTITTQISGGGSLYNGTYEFGIAYGFNNFRTTDYYSISSPQSIFSHQNFGQSITVNMEGLDRNFQQYELLMIYTVNQATNYLSLGFYDTGQIGVTVTSTTSSAYTPLTAQEILTYMPKYSYASNLVSNDQYLLFSGLTGNEQLNYQPQAMNITAQYVMYQVPTDYYEKGGQLVGYLHDEVYAFAVQWLTVDGEWSVAYHIPGRQLTTKDTNPASGADVYETQNGNTLQSPIPTYLIYNTAGAPVPLTNPSFTNGEGVYATGQMAGWQSSLQYPDNKQLFPQDACNPIRHHKFPDCCNAARYQNGGSFMYILGVQFSNIELPKDSSGNYVTNLVGYRIVRSDRSGNRSIVANGVMSNVRGYTDPQSNVVKYSNYPFNSLSADPYLSSTPVSKSGTSERGYTALKTHYADQFSLYAPHCLFNKIGLGTDLQVYTQEVGTVDSFFEQVYQLPGAKLLTQFDLYFALILGALDGYYATTGRKVVTVTKDGAVDITLTELALIAGDSPVTSTGPLAAISNPIQEQAADDALKFTSGSALLDSAGGISGIIGAAENIAEIALRALAEAGVFVYFAIQTAQAVINILLNLGSWQHYGYQYDSHCLLSSQNCESVNNIRRNITDYRYIYDGLNTLSDGSIFNNYKRESCVYLQLNQTILECSTLDTTLQTISQLGLCSNPTQKLNNTIASMYYVAVKNKIPDQYGELDGISYLDTGQGALPLTAISIVGSTQKFYQTPAIFGGDTYINKFSIRREQQLFSNIVTNVPDGYIIDYANYPSLGYPRFWIDTTPYDLGGAVSLSPTVPSDKHNLDCGGSNINLQQVTVVKDGYFYTSVNGVLEFFVESDYNLDYRDYKNTQAPSFYSQSYSDLSLIFRSDNINIPEEFTYDLSLSKQLLENTIVPQDTTFDPTLDTECFAKIPNRVIYSLPATQTQHGDNWLIYLPLNYYDFPIAEFGNLSAMHAVDNQQIVFLFDKAGPYITIGRDEMQLDGSGKTITLGDGFFFSRPPRPILYTDFYYGNSQSEFAFVNTQYGAIYPSQRQGRLFNLQGQQLNEISREGMHYWFKQYLPSMLLQQFPNFQDADNAVVGVGLISGYDPIDDRYYLCKRDYILNSAYQGKVTYDATKNQFFNDFLQVQLTDTEFFTDVSWTLSYSPKDKMFVSFHDWHPSFILQTENHFMTVSGQGIWKHNQRCDSFCNFYSTDYPFEIEYVTTNGINNQLLRSIEYYLDAGIYYNCNYFHQTYSDNFDQLVVFNHEQISGIRQLHLQDKTNLVNRFNYPSVNGVNGWIDIGYDKRENRYRINQITDITNDRGEFTGYNYPLWIPDMNGYTKSINPAAINLNKPVQQQKKFRNLFHRILLTKLVSGPKKFIFKFADSKQVPSPR